MDSIEARDLKSLDYEEVMRLAPELFDPEHAFLPITEEDVKDMVSGSNK
jgi:hypothetical protein